MADNRPPPREKNAMDNRKLGLSGTPWPDGKKPSLQWSLVSNNPRITVFTNEPNDANNSYGKITAALDMPAFYTFLALLRRAIDSEGEFKNYMDNQNYTFYGGKRSDTPKVLSQLFVGKDKDGVLWMSVTDSEKKDRPRIRFEFLPSDFHFLHHGDGKAYSKAEMSKLTAEAHYSMLTNLMAAAAVAHYVEPAPYNGGGGGGGGNRGGYGGGNNSGGGNRSYGSGGGGGNGGGGGAREEVTPEADLPF